MISTSSGITMTLHNLRSYAVSPDRAPRRSSCWSRRGGGCPCEPRGLPAQEHREMVRAWQQGGVAAMDEAHHVVRERLPDLDLPQHAAQDGLIEELAGQRAQQVALEQERLQRPGDVALDDAAGLAKAMRTEGVEDRRAGPLREGAGHDPFARGKLLQ